MNIIYNNIIYYEENKLNFRQIYSDIFYFEKKTRGAFINCSNLQELDLICKEILNEFKKNKKITFNIITIGSKFEIIYDFIKKNKYDIFIKNFVFIVSIKINICH